MKELLRYLPEFRGKKIGVFGDLIADEYVYGTIHRFSREAPVFIVNYEESEICPGGAANAAHNIQVLGGVPFPIGFVGNDLPGRTLFSALNEKGIFVDGIVQDDKHPTFIKQRIVAGSPHSVKQQILRLDRCLRLPDSSSLHAKLLERLEAILPQLDALIVSDYGLGVVQPQKIMEQIKNRGIPCFIDSRQNLGQFKGITAATPNEPEVEALIGKPLEPENFIEAGINLLQELDAQALLITRGKNGMALFTKNEDPVFVPIFGSSDIVDVTGAGDTVITTFALAVCAGASFADAARLSNCAAGIVVMKRGAATVSPDELSEAIRIASMHE